MGVSPNVSHANCSSCCHCSQSNSAAMVCNYTIMHNECASIGNSEVALWTVIVIYIYIVYIYIYISWCSHNNRQRFNHAHDGPFQTISSCSCGKWEALDKTSLPTSVMHTPLKSLESIAWYDQTHFTMLLVVH